MLHRERPDERLIGDREHRRIRADAQRQCQDRGCREDLTLSEHSDRVLRVLKKRLQGLYGPIS